MGIVLDQFDELGFAVVPGVFEERDVCALKNAMAIISCADGAPGIRDLIAKSNNVLELAKSPEVRALVEPIIGKGAAVVRSIFFNKSAESNWQVAWHQDLAIAVKEKFNVNGFDRWSMKDNIPHVQPPVEVLERMVTVRLHLDPANEANGALWVVPGSHRFGRLPADRAAGLAEEMGKHLCSVEAGGLMVFRPLILHASKKSVSDVPRRVVHLEFAAQPLPEPLEWWEWVA